ncbi:hypothetical protein N431DRAFT_97534 [Stipitochalara longipes BDJ]|nr:hypothetical protein N431DRAFT_97534 [Stipitochalara longipes BDJ]
MNMFVCFHTHLQAVWLWAGFLILFFSLAFRRHCSFGWLAGLDIHCIHGVSTGVHTFSLLHTHSVLAELERCPALNISRIRRDEIR